MANYKVLARKYRPNSFAELKGQDVFVRILNNSIKHNKIAHAYLLTGIRGVGKTSIARIVARTISCESPKDSNGLVVPCEICKNCKLIEAGNHNDILEFDAASRTGVNDIRDIIDSVHYSPVFSKYKIYIIDEVHMLSNSAFNALLKILEEPPHNVIFIFATTEIRKVPLTIISRCQRFDLHRFSVDDIVKHLENVCQGENIDFDKDALDIVAKHSEGSMRDALTMLESIVAIRVKKLDAQLVREVLGINDIKSLYSLLYYLLSGKTSKALESVQEIYDKGSEVSDVVNDLMVVATRLSRYLASDKYDSLLESLDSYEIELLTKLADTADISKLTIIWQILLKGLKELKFVDDSLSAFEMLVIRCCYASSLPSLGELLQTSNYISTKQEEDSKQKVASKEVLSGDNISFDDVVKLFYQNKEMILYHQLRSEVNCHGIYKDKLLLSIDKKMPKDFVVKVINVLNKVTGRKWQVEESPNGFEKSETIEAKELYKVENNAIVKNILKDFPGTKIKNINSLSNN